jgi:hypothetical protein
VTHIGAPDGRRYPTQWEIDNADSAVDANQDEATEDERASTMEPDVYLPMAWTTKIFDCVVAAK